MIYIDNLCFTFTWVIRNALLVVFVLFLDEKHQKSRAAGKKAKNFPAWLK
jgi:hypothetical protein